MATAIDLAKRLFGITGPRRSSPMASEGTAGDIVDSGGYVVTVERSPSLVGREKYRTFSELLTNTTIVATGVRYFLLLLSSSEWTVEPAKDEEGEPLPGAEEVAAFVKDVIHDMKTPWARVVRRAALYRFYGFSVQEWVAKRREDGRIGMKDVQPRPQSTIERWDLDGDEYVIGMVQQSDYGGEFYVPRSKTIYIVDDALSNTPDGLGLFRHMVRPAERLRAYEELEELAFETDLRGTPIGRAPLTEIRELVKQDKMSPTQANEALKAVRQFINNKLRNKSKGALLNSETYRNQDEAASPSPTYKYSVELLRGDAQGEEEVAAAIQRMNQELARLLGVEHLMLGSDGTGSLALGQTKLSNFFLTVTSTQNDIAEGMQRDFIATVCDLNGVPKELHPSFSPEEIDMMDVAALGQLLADIAQAGAPVEPGDPAVNDIRSRVGLPAAPDPIEFEDDDAALGGRTLPGQPPQQQTPPPGQNPEDDKQTPPTPEDEGAE